MKPLNLKMCKEGFEALDLLLGFASVSSDKTVRVRSDNGRIYEIKEITHAKR